MISEKMAKEKALAAEVVRLAQNRLLVRYRFLDRALFKMQPRVHESVCGTDGRSWQYVPARLLARYADDREAAVHLLLHSLLHNVFRHFFANVSKPDLWDIACDMMAEKIVSDLKVCSVSAERAGVLKNLQKEIVPFTAEKIYARLVREDLNAERIASLAALFYEDDHVLWYGRRSVSRKEKSEEKSDARTESGNASQDAVREEMKRPEQAPREETKEQSAQVPPSEVGEQPDQAPQEEEGKQIEGGSLSLPSSMGELPEQFPGEAAGGPSEGTTSAVQANGKDGNAASEPIGLAQGWQEIARRMQVELEHFARGGQGSSDLSMQLAFANRERQDYSVFLKRFAAMLREQMHVDLDTFDYNYYSYGLHLYGNMPLVEPLEYRETKVIRSFAIVLDTSGSVDRSLLEKFLQKTYDCLLSEESFAKRFAVHIVQADCKVQSDICIHSAQELQEYLRALTIRGRGGTAFRPALEYVEKLQKDGSLPDLKGALYFTDGEGTFPKRKPPFEVAFVYVGEEAFRAKVPAWALKVVFSEDDDEVKIV